MRGARNILFVILFSSALPGCGSDASTEPGRLMLERTSPRPHHLATLPAHARYCARDTTLTIVSLAESWSAAVALKTRWPAGRRFSVDSVLAAEGSAAGALRQ